MTKDQYLNLQKYFQAHQASKRLAHFFAMQVIFFYILLPFFLVWNELGREFIVASGLALVVSWGVLVQLIAFLHPVARPYQQYGFMPAGGSGLFSDIDKHLDSFPSGHITALVVLTLLMFMFDGPLVWVSLVTTILVAISRVILGYHRVRDMFGGLFLAISVVYILHILGVFLFIFDLIN